MLGLNEVLAATSAGGDAPCLVEVGRRVVGGEPAGVGYYWSTGRIRATLSADEVRLERRLGKMGACRSLVLTWAELQRLAAAGRSWAAGRQRWASFHFSCGGYPAGYGGAWRYTPPGAASQSERLATETVRGSSGTPPGGEEELRPLVRPRGVSAGVEIVAEIWRTGACRGPRAGSLVGLRYALGDGLALDAWRYEAKVCRGEGETLYLEPGEERFLIELEAVATMEAGAGGRIADE